MVRRNEGVKRYKKQDTRPKKERGKELDDRKSRESGEVTQFRARKGESL